MNDKTTKKFLCIIDMQNDFLTGPLGSEHCRRAIPNVVKLLDSDKWFKVYLTLDTHDDKYAETLEGRKLPVTHCIEHTWGHKICKELADAVKKLSNEDEIPPDTDIYQTIFKYTFGSQELIWDIQNHIGKDDGKLFGEDVEIHMCGVCTSICVLANAVLLRAQLPNAKIIIHADACSDVDSQMHRHALACLQAQQCDIVYDEAAVAPECC